MRKAIKDGADVNAMDTEGRTALHLVSGFGMLESLRILLDANALIDVKDKNNNTPLHYASGYGQAETVKILLQR